MVTARRSGETCTGRDAVRAQGRERRSVSRFCEPLASAALGRQAWVWAWRCDLRWPLGASEPQPPHLSTAGLRIRSWWRSRAGRCRKHPTLSRPLPDTPRATVRPRWTEGWQCGGVWQLPAPLSPVAPLAGDPRAARPPPTRLGALQRTSQECPVGSRACAPLSACMWRVLPKLSPPRGGGDSRSQELSQPCRPWCLVHGCVHTRPTSHVARAVHGHFVCLTPAFQLRLMGQ